MRREIYSDMWGELLFDCDFNEYQPRVYIYVGCGNNILQKPLIVFDNKLMIEKMIKFLQDCLKELYKRKDNEVVDTK